KLALIDRAGALVPIGMEREQNLIIVVDEARVDLIFHGVGLTAKVGAYIGNVDRLTVFIRPFVADFAGLGLPLPLVRSFEESGNFPVPGVPDGLNLVPRINSVGLGNLVENWRALWRLRPGGWSN